MSLKKFKTKNEGGHHFQPLLDRKHWRHPEKKLEAQHEQEGPIIISTHRPRWWTVRWEKQGRTTNVSKDWLRKHWWHWSPVKKNNLVSDSLLMIGSKAESKVEGVALKWLNQSVSVIMPLESFENPLAKWRPWKSGRLRKENSECEPPGSKGARRVAAQKKKKRKEEKRRAPTTKGKRFFSENRKKFVPNRWNSGPQTPSATGLDPIFGKRGKKTVDGREAKIQ